MAVDVTMTPATVEDAVAIATRLRPADEAEVRASSGKDPRDILVESVKLSTESWTVRFNGELACIWGVHLARRSHDGILTGRIGAAWLLTTELVERHARTFWRLCLGMLPLIFERWAELYNEIDARHVQALRWAKRLGFRLGPPAPFGAARLPFHPFRVTKGDLCASR